ncbi:unnamed protein product [Microthlaspi erraticum]|uniref:Arabidopsis retrotransposon Orf1 C-terminal domain-containing protein n=1 Tax=Microthlaspi erraticum TaxID=1685480 RepID=A0A6D2I434_9BRAS|nr:unnamed protein product [Microthlaspi erraticum]
MTRGNQDEPMEEAEEEQEEDELPMYQEHYNALFSMDFVRPSTHMMTHERSWIFEDVELVLKNMQLGSSSLTAWSLTRSSLVSFWLMRYHSLMSSIELSWTKAGAHHLTHKDGKKIRGDRAHAGNLMPLLEQLQAYKVTAYNTRHQRGRKLSVGGVITPFFVQLEFKWTREATPPGWMDIKFCKTNLLIEHKELDGRFQFKFTHPIGWTPPSFSCPTLSSPQ